MYNDLFKSITPISAYWLGLIASDGCVGIYNNSHQFSIGLKLEDMYILQKLAVDLGYTESNVKIRKQSAFSSLQISCKSLVNDLMNLNITPRKSRTINGLCIPNEHQNHFVRGVFDGDGTATCFKRNNGKYKPILAIYGHKPFLQAIIDQTVFVGNIYANRGEVFCLTSSTYDNIVHNINYMYENANDYKLNRKYLSCMNIIDVIQFNKSCKYLKKYDLYINNRPYKYYKCKRCDGWFIGRADCNPKYCSTLCANYRNQELCKYDFKIGKRYYINKMCKNCDTIFSSRCDTNRVYCSKKCSIDNKRNNYASSRML